jgi:hypothetical protein
MPLATNIELKARIQKSDAVDDTTLTALIACAERAINRYCNRPDGFLVGTAALRYFTGTGEPVQPIDECAAITLVEVKDSYSDTAYVAWATPTTYLAGDGDWIPFRGDSRDPIFDTPFTGLMCDPNGDYALFISGARGGRTVGRHTGVTHSGVPTVRVTAQWGYAVTAPADIKEACLFQAAIIFKRFQGSGATILATPELGQLEMYSKLDPFVEQVLRLGRYIRPVVGRR